MIIVALIVLSGCAVRQPVWQDRQRIVNISGNETAGMAPEPALRRMLVKGARISIDHGYRYFALIRPVATATGSLILRPSSDITIRLIRENEIRYPAPGVWDAYDLLGGRRAPG